MQLRNQSESSNRYNLVENEKSDFITSKLKFDQEVD